MVANDRYRAQERYVFGWTDYRGMYRSPAKVARQQTYDMSTDPLTNFMGMLIIVAPIAAIAYWLWFG